MVAQKHTTAERIQALALIEEGVPVDRVTAVSGMSKASIYRLQKTARARGYDPTVSRKLKDEYVQDAPRSGRPKKLSPEQEQHLLEVLQNNRNPSTGNTPEKTMQQLASEAGISSVSVYRIMRKYGLQKTKPAVPGAGGASTMTPTAPASAPAAPQMAVPPNMTPQTPVPIPVSLATTLPAGTAPMQAPMQAALQAPMPPAPMQTPMVETPVPVPGTMQAQMANAMQAQVATPTPAPTAPVAQMVPS